MPLSQAGVAERGSCTMLKETNSSRLAQLDWRDGPQRDTPPQPSRVPALGRELSPTEAKCRGASG